jgi:hypothetical protein
MFAQADGFVYDLKNLNGSLGGLDRSQVDVVYTGGVSYRLPF